MQYKCCVICGRKSLKKHEVLVFLITEKVHFRCEDCIEAYFREDAEGSGGQATNSGELADPGGSKYRDH